MGISCFQEKGYTSLKSQFNNKTLLIGLKANKKLTELNSILQCLCHIEPLVDYYKYEFDKIKEKESYKLYHKKDLSLSDSFRQVIDKIWPDGASKRKKENPQYFQITDSYEFLEMIYLINPNYNENQEYLLNFILTRLHKELIISENNNDIFLSETNKDTALSNYNQNNPKQNRTKIDELFFGKYYTNLFCNNCNNNFYIFQPYIYGSYSLDQVYNYKNQTCQNGINELYNTNMINLNINEINIYDCLYYEKQMKNKNQLCRKCAIMTECRFQNIIYSSSKIITFIFNKNISLQNFFFSYEEKINIDLFVEEKNGKFFDLIGIIYSPYPNNYISYCKSPIDNKWYSYEDQKVEIKNNCQEIFQNIGFPYILFYQISES